MQPEQFDVYHVFVASPGDVGIERQAVRDFFDDYNLGPASRLGIRFDVVDWESYSTTGVGRPQGLITEQCLERFRSSFVLVVGIMAQRLGTPTGESGSGTQEEIEWALAAWRASGFPEVKCFFRRVEQFQAPADADLDDALDQFKRLKAFRAELEGGDPPLFCAEYPDAGTFRDVLSRDLNVWLSARERPWWRAAEAAEETASDDDQPPPTASSAADESELARYRAVAESLHANLALAGFQTRLRVPIDLEALHVPLRANVDLRAAGRAEFADAEDADRHLRMAEATSEIPLFDAFREALGRGRRGIVVLGDPGAGKTTQLKRLLLHCLREGPETLGLEPDLVPVFLPLRELRDLDRGLDAFIEAELDGPHLGMTAGFGGRLRERGDLLLLFDGLDEVSDPARRAEVSRWIEQALTGRPGCFAAVTSRYAGYTDAARLDEHFLELHLRPLTREQSEEFIRRWYRIVETNLATDAERGEVLARERASQLVERLREPDYRAARLVEMTRNPLLLANICLVHRDGGALPRGRAKLYEECVEVLLETWRRSGKKLDVGVTAAEGRRVLQPAALWMHGEESRVNATADELAPILEPALRAVQWTGGDARAFLETVRDESGLLTGWSAERYGLMHLGFQEYLAACEIRRLAAEGKTEALADLASRWGESWWQEVILVLVALQNPSSFDPLLREVVKRPAFSENEALLSMVLEDAAEPSAAPFLDLVAEPAGDDPAHWARQATALGAVAALETDEVLDELAGTLVEHPSPEVRSWAGARRGAAVHLGRHDVFHTDPGGVEIVLVPGGSFVMGSPEDEVGRWPYESPQRHVAVGDFYLGRYAVTNEQYGRFMAANPDVREPEFWSIRQFNGARQPVVGVSWDEATRFCTWVGGRLPSEAEWEYAARAGSTTAYWWGDEQGENRANFAGSGSEWSGEQTAPVNAFEPNAFGLYQMLGNAFEWCADTWHSDYRGAPDDGSAWECDGDARVVRGGSWLDVPRDARSACRGAYPPGNRSFYVGFRVLCSPPIS